MPETPGALRYWADHLNLRGFNPAAPAMMTDAKRAMFEASADDVEIWAHDLKAGSITLPNGKTVPDLVTAGYLHEKFWADSRRHISLSMITTALDKAGIGHLPTRRHRLRVLRNAESWRGRTHAERNRYFEDATKEKF